MTIMSFAKETNPLLVAMALREESFKEFTNRFLGDGGHLELCSRAIQKDDDFPEGFRTREALLEYARDWSDSFIQALNYMYDVFEAPEGKSVPVWEEYLDYASGLQLAWEMSLIRNLLMGCSIRVQNEAGACSLLESLNKLEEVLSDVCGDMANASVYEVRRRDGTPSKVDEDWINFFQGAPKESFNELNSLLSRMYEKAEEESK